MMDPSILKLLEEFEDESMISPDEVDALLLDIEGDNHSSNQQFATWTNGPNGIGDDNTNFHRQHTLESTQMNEQDRSILGNQNQGAKRENESHSQHSPPKDQCLPGQPWQNPSQIPQASNLQSVNNPIGSELERPQPRYLEQQKMSSQEAHGTEKTVNHGSSIIRMRDLVRNLILQVDKDKGMQLYTIYSKFKRNGITKEELIQHMKGIAGDQMIRLAANKLQQRRDMENNQSVKSTSVGGPIKPKINMTTVPKFERPTSVNCPRRDLEDNSSLPLCSAPGKGSVTKDQIEDPLSSVVHVKNQSNFQAQTPRSLVQQGVSCVPVKQNNGNPRRSNEDLGKQSSQMGLSTSTTHASFGSPSVTTQVNFPALPGITPAGANIRTTQKMPSVQKKPLEAVGSFSSPSSKKQKLCGSSLMQSMEQFSDVTAVSSINLREEEEELLRSGTKEKIHITETSERVVHEEEEKMILQKIPLRRKLTEIMAKNGLKHINDDVVRCLSWCVEERMRGLLSNIIRTSKQRIDTKKCRSQTCITSDIRKQINEMNQKMKEEWERKHGGEEKSEENDTEKGDNRSKKVKANKEHKGIQRVKAANVAALAAIGGNDASLKWKFNKFSSKKHSLEKPYGGRRIGKKQSLTKAGRSISVKDVIAVVEKEHQMSRSTLLYRLYNRI